MSSNKPLYIAIGVTVGVVALIVTLLCILWPKPILGSETVYNTVTLQLGDDLYYDVRVPPEAKLLYTDGATVYEYDILTVGLQDEEPKSFCKHYVGGRWVFATSADRWYRATLKGFEQEHTYHSMYDPEAEVTWTDTIPKVVINPDPELLEALKAGTSKALGGKEFVSASITYGTVEDVCHGALGRMVALYKQPVRYGYKSDTQLWVTSNNYTVGVTALNYNTCLVVYAYGDEGKQYAAKLMGEHYAG